MAPPHPQVTWPRTPQTGHVLSTVRRTAPQSLFSGQCCDVHPEILGHLQQLSWQQAQVLERLDTLIAVLSGPSEYISPIHSPVTASPNSTTPQHAGQQTQTSWKFSCQEDDSCYLSSLSKSNVWKELCKATVAVFFSTARTEKLEGQSAIKRPWTKIKLLR